jgi:metal-responsive CopG/Arc/MetJ family transcriptional regulator
MLGFSVPPPLAEEVEALAKEEHRTKSELFREMLRVYIIYRRKRREEEEDRLTAMIIEEARTEKTKYPKTIEEELAEEEELARYGEKQSKKLGIQTEEDIDKAIREYRTERRRV